MAKITVIQVSNGKEKTMDNRYADILFRLGRIRFIDTIIQKTIPPEPFVNETQPTAVAAMPLAVENSPVNASVDDLFTESSSRQDGALENSSAEQLSANEKTEASETLTTVKKPKSSEKSKGQ